MDRLPNLNPCLSAASTCAGTTAAKEMHLLEKSTSQPLFVSRHQCTSVQWSISLRRLTSFCSLLFTSPTQYRFYSWTQRRLTQRVTEPYRGALPASSSSGIRLSISNSCLFSCSQDNLLTDPSLVWPPIPGQCQCAKCQSFKRPSSLCLCRTPPQSACAIDAPVLARQSATTATAPAPRWGNETSRQTFVIH